ncbi:MAG: helix-turn-helix transcriptional regulator [Clostridia bacterium]|nr:helix-turn-helix transcriptional regulator [Clostridia bacterium]
MENEVLRMKTAVASAGLSYMDLEQLTGVSHSTLQRYLNGKTNRIPLSAVEKIAAATGVSPAWIMGWESEPLSITQKVGKLTQHEEKVVLAYRDKPAIQPAVDKLLDVSPSEEPEILVAARGTPVSPQRFIELVDSADTLPDFVD